MSRARACVGEGNGDLRNNGSFRYLLSLLTAARFTGGRRKRKRKEQRKIRGNIEREKRE